MTEMCGINDDAYKEDLVSWSGGRRIWKVLERHWLGTSIKGISENQTSARNLSHNTWQLKTVLSETHRRRQRNGSSTKMSRYNFILSSSLPVLKHQPRFRRKVVVIPVSKNTDRWRVAFQQFTDNIGNDANSTRNNCKHSKILYKVKTRKKIKGTRE